MLTKLILTIWKARTVKKGQRPLKPKTDREDNRSLHSRIDPCLEMELNFTLAKIYSCIAVFFL